jgi:hypothetical protein
MRERGAALVEPTAEAQRRWADHVKKMYATVRPVGERSSPVMPPTPRISTIR